MDYVDRLPLQHISRPQPRHGHVLFAIVRVHRSNLLNSRIEILHRIVTCFDHAAVFFDHAHVRNFQPLIRRVIPKAQLSPGLYARLTLHSHSKCFFQAPRPIIFKAKTDTLLLDNKGLFGKIILAG